MTFGKTTLIVSVLIVRNNIILAIQHAIEERNITEKDLYYLSYANISVHEDMLKDVIRTGAYQRAILNNTHIFKDKIILDIGTGTGILSLFAAKAGAKKVYAIENSSIGYIAKEVIKQNGYDHIIQVIHTRVEDAEIEDTKVDVIISEWMGYFLLFEDVLKSILFARDKVNQTCTFIISGLIKMDYCFPILPIYIFLLLKMKNIR